MAKEGSLIVFSHEWCLSRIFWECWTYFQFGWNGVKWYWVIIVPIARFYKSCEQSTREKFKETKEIRKSSYSFPEDENFPHKTMGSNLQIFPSAQQVSLTLTSGWAVISLTLFSLLYLISFISLTFLLGDHSQRLCFCTVK